MTFGAAGDGDGQCGGAFLGHEHGARGRRRAGRPPRRRSACPPPPPPQRTGSAPPPGRACCAAKERIGRPRATMPSSAARRPCVATAWRDAGESPAAARAVATASATSAGGPREAPIPTTRLRGRRTAVPGWSATISSVTTRRIPAGRRRRGSRPRRQGNRRPRAGRRRTASGQAFKQGGASGADCRAARRTRRAGPPWRRRRRLRLRSRPAGRGRLSRLHPWQW